MTASDRTPATKPGEVSMIFAAEYGLKADEYDAHRQAPEPRAQPRRAGRLLGDVERALLVQVVSRKHLGKFPTTGPRVICGPGENAGVVDIGDGQACIFKMESHNHPSYIEPYQGAATGRGRHHARRLHHGRAADRPAERPALRRSRAIRRPSALVAGVVAGIGGYGNCVGVPTVGGRDQLPPRLRRQHPGQRHVRGPGRRRQDLLLGRALGRPAGGLFRLQDRPRRHPRRDHGLGRSSTTPPTRSARPSRSATPSPRSC